jgi:hypothetical protein
MSSNSSKTSRLIVRHRKFGGFPEESPVGPGGHAPLPTRFHQPRVSKLAFGVQPPVQGQISNVLLDSPGVIADCEASTE